MTDPTAEVPAVDDTPAPGPRVLADLRRAACLTQVQVSARMGVSPDRVLKIEAAYPNLRFDTLSRYMQAIGGSVQLMTGTTRVFADQLVPDPTYEATRTYLRERKGKGNLVYVPSAKELPLKSDASKASGDDPGRDVDHPDTESDQGDGGQRQQG